MKVVIINKSDSTGGAAVVSYRLMEALCDAGVDARMLVAERLHDDPRVGMAAPNLRLKASFLRERLGIFLHNGMNRDTLFKIDTASCGVPLYRHPWVKEADVICLNWINQGLLGIDDIHRLLRLGKPVVWTMHDMWNMTGVCHHAGECPRWRQTCGECPLLGTRKGHGDISASTWQRKHKLYNRPGRRIHFVAVSHWLEDKAAESGLLAGQDVSVIPNAFHFDDEAPEFSDGFRGDRCRILFGAARLDDTVKGLSIMVRATEILASDYPDIAENCELVTFGNVKNPDSIAHFGISHTHRGLLSPDETRRLYGTGDIVASTSLYETLPGTLVEGQAWGCVPVATDRGGQRDIVDHGRTGYIAHFDGVENTARDIARGIAYAYGELQKNGAALRHAMLSSARSRFSAQSVAAMYLDLFARIQG